MVNCKLTHYMFGVKKSVQVLKKRSNSKSCFNQWQAYIGLCQHKQSVSGAKRISSSDPETLGCWVTHGGKVKKHKALTHKMMNLSVLPRVTQCFCTFHAVEICYNGRNCAFMKSLYSDRGEILYPCLTNGCLGKNI